MLYWLLFERLFHVFSPFRVFYFNTFRTAFASLTALFLSIVLGPWLIRKLREFQIGQHIREEGPASHRKKAGTPTMGGVLIIISVAVSTLLWANLRNPYVWIAIFGMLGFGAIGFYDDYTKLRSMRNLGLTARMKMLLQIGGALVIGFMLLGLHARGSYSTNMNVPFFKQFKPDLLISTFLDTTWTYPLAFLGFYVFIAFILVGSSNAVNLTDGLDGLAIGLMIIAAGAMTILTYVSGHASLPSTLIWRACPARAN